MSRYKGRVSASAIERIFRMWSKLSCLRAVSAIRTRMKITGCANMRSLWTTRSSEQFCTDFSFEVEETGWLETPKPSAQVFRFNLKNIC